MNPAAGYSGEARIGWAEWLPWIAAVAAFFLLPEYLPLGARILIFVLLALSLDLILGYAGIITLGHAAFFGVGAYTAGLLGARTAITDPFAQLVLAALAAAAFGAATGAVLLRTKGLALLMLTLAVAGLTLEAANAARPLTGGADGLYGIAVSPVLGLFRFDLFGKTAFLYCLAVLFLAWLLVRRIVYSPFGVMLTGIRENTARMQALGAHVYRRLLLVYTISAGLAGVAGGLLAQVNQIVGLNVLSFESSGELLVMLILGGVGRIYGAFLGPVIFIVAQDQLAKFFPAYWYLGIGAILVLVVLLAPGGVLGLADRMRARLGHEVPAAR